MFPAEPVNRSLWRYAWAAPATVLGLLAGAIALAGGATLRRTDGVLEIAGGRLGPRLARWPLFRHFCAVTLGHVVLGRDHGVLEDCRAHEHAHVAQYERWGPAFLILYAASSAWEALKGNAPYRDNHFERQARAAEGLCNTRCTGAERHHSREQDRVHIAASRGSAPRRRHRGGRVRDAGDIP